MLVTLHGMYLVCIIIYCQSMAMYRTYCLLHASTSLGELYVEIFISQSDSIMTRVFILPLTSSIQVSWLAYNQLSVVCWYLYSGTHHSAGTETHARCTSIILCKCGGYGPASLVGPSMYVEHALYLTMTTKRSVSHLY